MPLSPTTTTGEFGKNDCQIFKRQPRVLIVEDNSVNSKVVSLQLSILGCEYDCAYNGAEAVQALRDKVYDLVLMDCQMPILDGYAATKMIRQQEGEKKHTPIIAMTAHAMRGDREKCLGSGMDGYIAKPVTLAHLREAIRPWIPDGSDSDDGSTSP